jgi:hypothetical protein
MSDKLPAKRPSHAVTVSPPQISTGGPLQSMATRWQAERDARTTDSLTRKAQSLASYIDSRTQLVEKQTAHVRSLAHHQELPEILGHELAVRRVERVETYRHVQHGHEMNEIHRETDRTLANVVLTDARQQLDAQRQHGSKTYNLKWKKQDYETLDLEMSAEEKRAVLREQREEKHEEEPDEDVEAALYAQRDRLNAHGLDTSKVDAAIEKRKRR